MRYRCLETELIKGTGTDDKRKIVSFVASTSSPDRYGDVINQSGWDLSKYRKNPVILLNHNSTQLPIGKGEVDIIDGQLMVDIEFDLSDPIASEVARKTQEGFLSAVSVGFNSIESTPRSMLSKDDPFHAPRGQFFEKSELLEISIVTIPANGEAVAAKNFNPSKSGIWANGTLRSYIDELKHIIDVEMTDDKVIVTYLLHKEQPEEEAEQDAEEDVPKPDMEQDLPEDEELGYDEDEDEDKLDKTFLTINEREFFAFIKNGD